jgi:hypothetical protein
MAEDSERFVLRAFDAVGIVQSMLDQARDMVAAMRAVEPSIGDAIMMARAVELAAREGPRRPLSEELAELRELDLRRLRGDR